MQVDGASLDTQEEACNAWALRNGILITRTFREEGASAKTTKRPALQEMLEYVEQHYQEIDYLIVYDIDRLSRNAGDFMEITKMLAKYGIDVRDSYSSKDSGPSDKLVRNMKAVLAEFDNDIKSVRVKDNMKKQANEGYRMAKAPYGLRNVRDVLGNSTVEPVEGVAEHISYILNEYSKGTYTIRELIDIANTRGLQRPNGKPMDHGYMGKMLRNPLCAGLERSEHTDNELVDSIFEGIITPEAYRQNQQLLTGRSSKSGYIVDHPDYPLRRFVRCAECDGFIRGSASTGSNGKTYPRYHCSKCNKASIDPETLHTQFVELLENITPSDAALKLMREVIVRVWNDEAKMAHTQRKKLQSEVDSLREHKHNATDKLVMGDITKQEKTVIHQRADAKISGLQTEVDRLDRHMGTKQESIDYAINYMDNAAQLWKDAAPTMKLVYQGMIFPEGVKYSFDDNIFRTPVLSPLYFSQSTKKTLPNEEESLLVNYVKSKLNAICTELLEVYSYMRAITVAEYIPA